MTKHDMLDVVPFVELERYLGKWYEIAHLPAKFQEGCSETTATYSLGKDGNISVLNECKRNGNVKQAKGKAKVVDKTTGAKLKVTFFWPFYGDYWIIKIGKDYDYSVVGPRPQVPMDSKQNPTNGSRVVFRNNRICEIKGFRSRKLDQNNMAATNTDLGAPVKKVVCGDVSTTQVYHLAGFKS